MIHAVNVSPTNMHALMVNVAEAAAKVERERGDDWIDVYMAMEQAEKEVYGLIAIYGAA